MSKLELGVGRWVLCGAIVCMMWGVNVVACVLQSGPKMDQCNTESDPSGAEKCQGI